MPSLEAKGDMATFFTSFWGLAAFSSLNFLGDLLGLESSKGFLGDFNGLFMLRRFTADLVGLLQSALVRVARRSGVRGTAAGEWLVGDTVRFSFVGIRSLGDTNDLLGEHNWTGLSGMLFLDWGDVRGDFIYLPLGLAKPGSLTSPAGDIFSKTTTGFLVGLRHSTASVKK